uniref:Uncharacterized protein n=1 Tax=Lepeophtheirus salmonis TaxID=72036 RepID=A0A0K2TH92_LEPSM
MNDSNNKTFSITIKYAPVKVKSSYSSPSQTHDPLENKQGLHKATPTFTQNGNNSVQSILKNRINDASYYSPSSGRRVRLFLQDEQTSI